MTDLQRVEFDMLRETVRICDDLKLNYFLVCGSALGAVKYGGFIPWDDDMDVGLFRKDYEIFLKMAPSMLPDHLSLQSYATDPNYPNIFGKLRNSNTTFIEKSSAKLPINHGVYIDIFPLDGYPLNEKKQDELELTKRKCQKRLSCVFDLPRSFRSSAAAHFRRMCGWHKKSVKVLEEYTRAISAYPIENSSIICNHGNWQGKLEYAPKEQYGNGVMMEFEGLTVRVPERYDEYLTQKYGDWRADLPKDQQVGHHYAEVIDLSRPYTDYIEHLKNGKVRIKCPGQTNNV